MAKCPHFKGWQEGRGGPHRWPECGMVLPDGGLGGVCMEARCYPDGSPCGDVVGDGCAMYQRARAEAAEGKIEAAEPHLRTHCEKCGGYARQSSTTNDEPPCATCLVGFVVEALDLGVWPEDYR